MCVHRTRLPRKSPLLGPSRETRNPSDSSQMPAQWTQTKMQVLFSTLLWNSRGTVVHPSGVRNASAHLRLCNGGEIHAAAETRVFGEHDKRKMTASSRSSK
mmetsp:Transcript_11169/g.24917  ORF Transcript_11169/g.24917 Transcript_11169/m.24917 type:complete len:101 (+) Transcript_11169:265-567(+)